LAIADTTKTATRARRRESTTHSISDRLRGGRTNELA
jgi:hypothetical protein